MAGTRGGRGSEQELGDEVDARSAPPFSEQKESGTALLRALRHPRDEAQFTQVLAAVASVDSRFAAAFVDLVVSAAEAHARRKAAQSLRGDGLPDVFRCRAEENLAGPIGGLGRVDMRFDGGEVTLLVENKLHSGYGREQLSRYLRALDSLPPSDTRSGLVAITRNVPTLGEADVANHPRWLGSVRWAHLKEGLRDLPIEDASLRGQWLALLTVMEEDGDLGTTDADADLIRAWASYRRGRAHLVDLMDQIWEPTLQHLQAELKANNRTSLPREGLADLKKRGQRGLVVQKDQGNVYSAFHVPAGSNDHPLQIGFEAYENEPFFTVWVRPREGENRLIDGERQLRSAIDALESSGFVGYRGWWTKSFPPAAYLEAPDVPLRLLDLAKETISIVCASGVLKGDVRHELERSRLSPRRRRGSGPAPNRR